MTAGAQEQEPGSHPAPPVAEQLSAELRSVLGALGQLGMTAARGQVTGLIERLTEYVEQQGKGNPSLVAALTGARSMAEGKGPVRSMMSAGWAGLKGKLTGGGGGDNGQGGGQGRNLKVTNIVESIDVGVPIRVAYNQWTQFRDFPSFMKKVENVDQEEDTKLHWKAQVFWSHRDWESTIVKQAPDECIVWRSKGAKGYVDGAVTFHEVAPNMTRILVVLEYNPQGLFERTGNLWRAQGRRARLELKHFRRHVMTQTILNPEEVEGWRGVIEDSEVVQDHESRVREEQEQEEQQPGAGAGEEPEDEAGGYEDEPEDEAEGYDEAEPEDEAEDYEDEPEDEAEGYEEEPDEEEEEPRREPAAAGPVRRRRSR